MNTETLTVAQIIKAIQRRNSLKDSLEAYRLYNGFYEGCPGLILDLFGSTLVIFDHKTPGSQKEIIHEISEWAQSHLDGIESVLLKQRQHPDESHKNGLLIHGTQLPQSISEFGIRYALDLQLNQDASFYLDTRNLRRWLKDTMNGSRVLNTFAYTGSLGAAAGMGGAELVVQTDLNAKFLEIARRSWVLNELPEEKGSLLIGDFFRVTGRMRNQDRLFDCVIIDPPYFSTTDAGKVDWQQETSRLINKVRPLVAHEGWLVVINNALFLAGDVFMAELETLCESPYLAIGEVIPVPLDVTGYPDSVISQPPVDPAPFNHPTKIVVLKIYRKDQRK